MAGLSYCYAFFNLYSMGGGLGVPSLDDAMQDIESCLAVLDYLSRERGPILGGVFTDRSSSSPLGICMP